MQDGSEIILAMAGGVHNESSIHPVEHTCSSMNSALQEEKLYKQQKVLILSTKFKAIMDSTACFCNLLSLLTEAGS